MNAKDAIRSSAGFSTMVLKTYISDLDDADLMRRPGEGCNHLAWQLGHLISSEVQLLDKVGSQQGCNSLAGLFQGAAGSPPLVVLAGRIGVTVAVALGYRLHDFRVDWGGRVMVQVDCVHGGVLYLHPGRGPMVGV